jgi:hypothetical protein
MRKNEMSGKLLFEDSRMTTQRGSFVPLGVALAGGWRGIAGFLLIARAMAQGEVPGVPIPWLLLTFVAQGVALGVVGGLLFDGLFRYLLDPALASLSSARKHSAPTPAETNETPCRR